MVDTNPDIERLLDHEGVHTVAPRPDDGEVVLGCSRPASETDDLPRTARIDGHELVVIVEQRPKPESGGYKLARARAAHRAASAGYHPRVSADYFRQYQDALESGVLRGDGSGGDGSLATKPPDSDAAEGSADARSGPRDEKQRPLAGGLVVGPGGGDYGTLAGPVTVTDTAAGNAVWASDVSEGDLMLVTNRHVLDGNLGDPVYQPSTTDGSYYVGDLAGYVPLEDGTTADIAAFAPADDLDLSTWSYWELSGVGGSVQRSGYSNYIGQEVTGSAANSGVVSGTLEDTGVTVTIDYTGFGDRTIYDTNQTNDISRGGDSGTQRFNADGELMDLNFGSTTDEFQQGGNAWGVTVANCESELGVSFLTPADLEGRGATGTTSGYVARGGALFAAGGAYTGPGDSGGGTDPTDPGPGDEPPGGDGTGTGNPPFAFDRTLNAVSDLGMDNSGNQPIDNQFDFRDGTLIEFPSGDYLISDGFNTDNGNALVGLGRWGMVGLGSTRDDVRFHTTQGEGRRLFNWGNDCGNIYLANLSFDQSDSLATSIRVSYNGDGGLYVYNIKWRGQQPNEAQMGPPDGDNPDLVNVSFIVHASANDVNEIVNFEHTVPEDVAAYPTSNSALGSYRRHEGTNYLRNAHIANRGEHAWYASRPLGNCRIEGGLFSNCANTNMRICGGGSWARDATVRIDAPVSEFTTPDGTVKSARGLRWESGGASGADVFSQSGGYVENCDLIYLTEKDTGGLLRVEGNAGAMDVRDCRIHSANSSGPVAYVEAIGAGPDGFEPPDPQVPVVFSGCDFTGSTSSPPIENDRSQTAADGCCNGLSSGYANVAVSNPESGPCDDPTA